MTENPGCASGLSPAKRVVMKSFPIYDDREVHSAQKAKANEEAANAKCEDDSRRRLPLLSFPQKRAECSKEGLHPAR